MNVTIERSTLAGALRTVMPAVGKGGRSLPVLAGVRLAYASDGVQVTATNLDLTIEHHIAAEPSVTAKDGTVVLPAQLLANIVGAMTGPMVVLDGDGIDVTATSGDTTATLRTLPTESWPNGLEADGESIVLDTMAVAMLAHAVKFAADGDDKGVMAGVNFGPDGIMATDSYRAIHHATPKPLPEATVPTETVAAVLRATAGPVVFTAGDRTASFATDDTMWTSSLLAGTHPGDGILRMLGNKAATSMVVEREVLAASLARVATLGDTKAVLTPGDGTVTLSAEAPEVGGITDTVPADGEFDVPVCFEVAYLASVIAAVAEDTITMHMHDSLKPVIVESERVKILIMPIRIGKPA